MKNWGEKLSNGRQSVACFKCKPACLKHFPWVKWYDVEARGVIHLSVTNTVTCFNLKTSKTIFETSQTISPRWQICFLLFLFETNLNWTKQLFYNILGAHEHPSTLFAGAGLRSYRLFYRRQTTGQRLQASLMWEALLTPITYSPALQGLIFITSIIFYHKYSNPDLKSRA